MRGRNGNMTSGTLHVEHMLMEMAKIFQEVDRLGGTRAGTEGEGHLVSQSAMGIAFRAMKIDTPPNVPTRVMREDKAVMTPIGATLRKTSMASVTMGTPGAGEPPTPLRQQQKSLDQQFYDQRPEVVSCDAFHYTSPEFLSFTFFGGSRKAQYGLEARADGADQGGLSLAWQSQLFHDRKGCLLSDSRVGVAA